MANIFRAHKIEDGTTDQQFASINASGELSVKNTDLETALTDKSQLTKITDGTYELSINTDGSLNTNIRDESGTAFSGTNPLYIHSIGEVSTANSTSTSLSGGATFTGTGEDIKNESVIIVSVYSDVASATDGLSIQFSTDNTNWDHTDVYTIAAATGKTFSLQPVARYFRVVYTNGGSAQSVFRLQALKKASYVKPSSHRVADEISNQDDAELVKSVITGIDDSGSFHNVTTTVDGHLMVADESSGLAISEGKITGKTYEHKFGLASDFDTTDGEVAVWEGANDGASNLMSYTYSSTADIDRLSSSDNGDTQDIEVIGLDTNLDLVTQTITLTGQTPVALTTSLKRVFRLRNVGSTNLAGRIYCFVNVTTTAGVPDTLTNIRAEIDDGNNQSLMAIYTIPNGKTGYLRKWNASIAGASKSSNFILKRKVRPLGQVFQMKDVKAISDTGSSSFSEEYIEPDKIESGSDIEITVEATEAGVTGAAISACFDLVIVDN